jgi:hypothetical protein
MGAEDVRRQALNVFRIQMLGAKVRLFYLPFLFPTPLDTYIHDNRSSLYTQEPAPLKTP